MLGRKLSSPTRITDLSASPESDGVHLSGRVDQNFPEVNLWPDSANGWDFDTSCSCSAGPYCAHAAALLFRASKPNVLSRLQRGLSATPPPPQPAPPQPAPQSSHPPEDPAPPHFHLTLREEPARSRPAQLLLQSLKVQKRDTWLIARPTVTYGQCTLPLAKIPSETDTPRDRPAEFRALELLQQSGLTNLTTNPSYRFLLSLEKDHDPLQSTAGVWFPDPHHSLPPARFWPWFRATCLPQLERAGWSVEVDPAFGHHLIDLEAASFETELQPIPGGWFTLSVGIDLAGEKLDLLPILLKLLDSQIFEELRGLRDSDLHLIYLPEKLGGGALKVPAGRLRHLLHHLSALTFPPEAQGLPALSGPDAAALAENGLFPVSEPPELKKLRATLHLEPLPFRQPDQLHASLRPYQEEGVRWLQSLAQKELNGILADDMGLGKTLQTLTHLLMVRDQNPGRNLPSLIVAPTSVVPNWLAEIQKFTPSLKPLFLQGPQRRRLFSEIGKADLILTSYALLNRDLDELTKHQFHSIILDEAQQIKNPSAQVTKAACQLNSQSRICLSGTPVENNLGELWSLMNFLMPGYLGSMEKFRERYQKPIEQLQDQDCAKALRKRLSPLILRRTKDSVAKDLPPKTILTHSIDLSSRQRDLYETVRATMDKRIRQAIAAQGLEQSQFAILGALLKLRQICCHPRLVKNKVRETPAQQADPASSAKLVYLFELLDTLFAEKRRVLLFSQFTSMLEIIESELVARSIDYLLLTGTSQNRGDLVKEYQDSQIPIFLISLKAGGTGLNLTAADTVIHYDPWWNPAAENQATDRAYRIGQTNPVFVHKLICTGTVEERINQLQLKKGALSENILEGAMKTAPSPEELLTLLAPEE